MSGTLTLTPGSGKAGASAPRRWGVRGRLDPVSVYLAPQLGLAPKSVEHLLRASGPRSVSAMCATIIRAFHATGDHERLARFLAPIDLAVAEAQPPELTDDLLMDLEESDAQDNPARAAFLMARDAASADTLKRRLVKLRLFIDRVVAALNEEYDLA